MAKHKAVNHIERAYRAWTVLTECAAAGTLISYGELAARLGIHHRPVRYVLGPIQDHCLEEKLPPLTILVVDRDGARGSGFIAYDTDRAEEGERLAFSHNWDALPNPFEFSADGTTYEEVVSKLTSEPGSASDVYRTVRSRGVAQKMFRDALLKVYRRRCCFTGLSFTDALEACHIVPWANCKWSERLDVRNGLLLNSLHHRLFDKGIMTVSTEYRILVREERVQRGRYSEFERRVLTDLHGKKMKLPSERVHWPAVQLLKQNHGIHKLQTTGA